MKLKTFLEPFSELLLLKANFSFRKMRFFGRIPFFRDFSFDSSYSNKLLNNKLTEIAESSLPKDIVNEISVNGYSSPIKLTADFLLYLEEIVSNTPFVNLKTGEGTYFF